MKTYKIKPRKRTRKNKSRIRKIKGGEDDVCPICLEDYVNKENFTEEEIDNNKKCKIIHTRDETGVTIPIPPIESESDIAPPIEEPDNKSHFFHKGCIKQHIDHLPINQRTCPMCRQNIKKIICEGEIIYEDTSPPSPEITLRNLLQYPHIQNAINNMRNIINDNYYKVHFINSLLDREYIITNYVPNNRIETITINDYSTPEGQEISARLHAQHREFHYLGRISIHYYTAMTDASDYYSPPNSANVIYVKNSKYKYFYNRYTSYEQDMIKEHIERVMQLYLQYRTDEIIDYMNRTIREVYGTPFLDIPLYSIQILPAMPEDISINRNRRLTRRTRETIRNIFRFGS